MLLIRRSMLRTWISGVGKEEKKAFQFLHCAVFYTQETATTGSSTQEGTRSRFPSRLYYEGQGGRLKSKLFHQIIAGRASVSFGK